MCGRFSLNQQAEDLVRAFRLMRCADFPRRFNIAPASMVPVVRQSPEGEWVADLLRWGLVPHDARDPAIGNRLANARCETVADKPSFAAAFHRRRCLVPASGFFEWQSRGRVKQPFYFSAKDGVPLALAGLWESWRCRDGDILRSFCLLTTGANATMAPVHDRMPVLISTADQARWLDPRWAGRDLMELLRPASAEMLQAWPVARAIGHAGQEGPNLIEPVTVVQGELDTDLFSSDN